MRPGLGFGARLFSRVTDYAVRLGRAQYGRRVYARGEDQTLIIAPQRKQQKETDQMLAALKKGDRVVTSGGLHGTVADFKEADKAVVLEVAVNVRVTVSRSAIASVKREAHLPTSSK